MTAWDFRVADIVVGPYAAAPELTARLHIQEHTGQTVHAIALRCQVKIEPQRRGYDETETNGLRGIFGDRERWSDTLRPFLWMQCNTMVQGFTDVTEVALPLPCTYDFEVTGSRYLHALGEGAIPLTLMFNGTVFTKGETGFGVDQIPWDAEARYDLPVAVWRELVNAHFPGKGWIKVGHEVIAALEDFRSRRGLISWEETFAELLTPTSLVADPPGLTP